MAAAVVLLLLLAVARTAAAAAAGGEVEVLANGGSGAQLLIPIRDEEARLGLWGTLLDRCDEGGAVGRRNGEDDFPCARAARKIPVAFLPALPQPPLVRTFQAPANTRDGGPGGGGGPGGAPAVVRVTLFAEARQTNFFRTEISARAAAEVTFPAAAAGGGGVRGGAAASAAPEVAVRNTTDVYTFNGTVPGPVIVARRGDVLRFTLVNNLPVDTGIFVPGIMNAKDLMEGSAVRFGDSATFDLALPEVGTFIYRSAVDAVRQVPLGLYGALIVQDGSRGPAWAAQQRVLALADPLVGAASLQVLPPLRTIPQRRAEENYNGRRGNVLVANGVAVHALPHVAELVPGTDFQLHVLNACNSRTLGVYVDAAFDLRDARVSAADHRAFLPGAERLPTESRALRRCAVLPPGATAALELRAPGEIPDAAALVVRDETPEGDFRRPAPRHRKAPAAAGAGAPGAGGDRGLAAALPPVVSEIHSPSIGDPSKKVVELLVIPSSDGFAPVGGRDFRPVSAQPRVALSPTVTDSAFLLTGAEEEQPAWGFDKRYLDMSAGGTSAGGAGGAGGVASAGGGGEELSTASSVSFLVELLCPSDVHVAKIAVQLFRGLAAAPDEVPLARAFASCDGRNPEIPLDFHTHALTRYFVEAVAAPGGDPLLWVRAKVEFLDAAEAPTAAAARHRGGGPQFVYLAASTGLIVPPPTLRVVFEIPANAERSAVMHAPHSLETLRIRQRRIERVFHELHQEQLQLQGHLQSLYHHLKKHQEAMGGPSGRRRRDEGGKGADGRAGGRRQEPEPREPALGRAAGADREHGGTELPADDGVGRPGAPSAAPAVSDGRKDAPRVGAASVSGLVADLEKHLKVQERQSVLERQVAAIKDGSLSEQEKRHALRDIQVSLHQQLLVQEQLLKDLRAKLENADTDASGDAGSSGPGSAGRRSLADADAALRSHQLPPRASSDHFDLVRLTPPVAPGGGRFRGHADGAQNSLELEAYKHQRKLYFDLHKRYSVVVREVNHLLSLGAALKTLEPQFENQSGAPPTYFTFEEARDARGPDLDVEVLRFRPAPGVPVRSKESVPHADQDRRRTHEVRLVSDDGNAFYWVRVPERQKLTVVELTIVESPEASSAGDFNMWFVSTVYSVRDGPLTPGELVMWIIKNPTAHIHPLYFHRAKLEIVSLEQVWLNGTRREIDYTPREESGSHTTVSQLSVPAAPEPGVNAASIVRALSVVPRIYVAPRGDSKLRPATAEPQDKPWARWVVKVQSAVLEYVANGLSTGVFFAVEAGVGDSAAALAAGIDFLEDDSWDPEAPEKARGRPVLLLGAAAGLAVAAAGAAVAVARSRDGKNDPRSPAGRQQIARAASAAAFAASAAADEPAMAWASPVYRGPASATAILSPASTTTSFSRTAAEAATPGAFSTERLRRLKHRLSGSELTHPESFPQS